MKCQIGQPPLWIIGDFVHLNIGFETNVFDARNLIIQVFKFFPWLSKAGSVHCLMLTAGSMLLWIINASKLLLVSHWQTTCKRVRRSFSCNFYKRNSYKTKIAETVENSNMWDMSVSLSWTYGRHVKAVNPHWQESFQISVSVCQVFISVSVSMVPVLGQLVTWWIVYNIFWRKYELIADDRITIKLWYVKAQSLIHTIWLMI